MQKREISASFTNSKDFDSRAQKQHQEQFLSTAEFFSWATTVLVIFQSKLEGGRPMGTQFEANLARQDGGSPSGDSTVSLYFSWVHRREGEFLMIYSCSMLWHFPFGLEVPIKQARTKLQQTYGCISE